MIKKTCFILYFMTLFSYGFIQSIDVLEANQYYIIILRQLDHGYIDPLGRLKLNNSQQIESLDFESQLDPCRRIFQSRLMASYSLEQSALLLESSSDCNRSSVSNHIWYGNLASLQGAINDARLAWNDVPDEMLLRYGQILFLKGYPEVAAILLQEIEERSKKWSTNSKNSDEDISLLNDLAILYRYSGQGSKSFAIYLRMWEMGGRSYEQAFYLANGLRKQGKYIQAIEIIEEGSNYAPLNLQRPSQLEMSYLEEWGQLHVALGQIDLAREKYWRAEKILRQAFEVWPEDAYLERQQHLTWLENQIGR